MDLAISLTSIMPDIGMYTYLLTGYSCMLLSYKISGWEETLSVTIEEITMELQEQIKVLEANVDKLRSERERLCKDRLFDKVLD